MAVLTTCAREEHLPSEPSLPYSRRVLLKNESASSRPRKFPGVPNAIGGRRYTPKAQMTNPSKDWWKG